MEARYAVFYVMNCVCSLNLHTNIVSKGYNSQCEA